MAAINSIVVRDAMNMLSKRKSWPAREVGVMVVFCIVFVVASVLIGLWIAKVMKRRKMNKPQSSV